MKSIKGKRIVIIGSGFGGLGAACLLARAGASVTILEKNEQTGGRASVFEADGFRFDMGPSWYLMPDVFSQFFQLLGEREEDYFELERLSPSYRIFFKDTERFVDIYSDRDKDRATIESLEVGAAEKLDRYLERAKQQYEIAVRDFMYKNYRSIFDFFTWRVVTQGTKLSVFTKMQTYVARYFKSEEMQKILQYPLVFLGSSPYNTPALYNIMSHIDFRMGVFYPKRGFHAVIEALQTIAEKDGTTIRLNSEVDEIVTENGIAKAVRLATGEEIEADVVISNADMYHTEMHLLKEKKDRSFSQRYWDKRVMAPSALVLYLGVKGEIPSLRHHTLLFSKDWQKNFGEIFEHPAWPEDPSLYVCNPSKTDDVAPSGHENLFVLVPIAAGLAYDDAPLKSYTEKILTTMENHMDIPDLRKRIVYKRTFCVDDFAARYNSYKGSALGLAHTLSQTAAFRPDTKSKKVKNLYYVGAGTNPGIGMPVCLISAQLVYKRLTGDRSAGALEEL
ncbi:MAG: phytoene desaturase family protein [bacterium]|nr:phytoene desaturase family protein [bacterium]MDA1024340.1 phytoene desaturase family protein [bacterium]